MSCIRDFLGKRYFYKIALSSFQYANACSAADVIGDAELAIGAYEKNNPVEESGLAYLQVYGVLQAAYMQQDAVRVLRQCCGLVDKKLSDGMMSIRNLRNSLAGHPTRYTTSENNKTPPASFVARYSVGGNCLSVHHVHHDGKSEFNSVQLLPLIKQHKTEVVEWLGDVVNFLLEAERQRRGEIMSHGPTVTLLHRSWTYLVSKLYETAHDFHHSYGVGRAASESLRKIIKDVVDGLETRSLPPIDHWHTQTAEAALLRYEEFFERVHQGKVLSLDMEAFASLAEKHLEYIQQYLESVDQQLQEAI